MDEHDCEELQVVELPGNTEGANERIRDGLEMGKNENGKECEELQVMELLENLKGAEELHDNAIFEPSRVEQHPEHGRRTLQVLMPC